MIFAFQCNASVWCLFLTYLVKDYLFYFLQNVFLLLVNPQILLILLATEKRKWCGHLDSLWSSKYLRLIPSHLWAFWTSASLKNLNQGHLVSNCFLCIFRCPWEQPHCCSCQVHLPQTWPCLATSCHPAAETSGHGRIPLKKPKPQKTVFAWDHSCLLLREAADLVWDFFFFWLQHTYSFLNIYLSVTDKCNIES